jgi:Putative transmembrane protein (PGPGW)
VPDFLSKDVLVGLGIFSLVAFIGTLIAIPIILVRLPADYFDPRRPRPEYDHPVLRVGTKIFKNVLGIIFLLAGIAMLVLPGQGILTMLIGISLMDFPGKRRLEWKFVSRPSVLNAINAIRHRFGRPPLIVG